MHDPHFFDNRTYFAANIASFGLDAAAVAVALALTFLWGRKLPAWLVLVPMWVGTGLLGTIVVLIPIAAPLAGSTPAGGAGPDALRSWVYVVVYAGFGAQGVLLLTAFALYAKDRWRTLLTARSREVKWGRSDSPGAGLRIAAAAALMLGVVNLAWSFGATAGLGGLAERQTAVDRATLGVYGLFSLATALGVRMVDGRPQAPAWVPLTLLWAGTSSMVTWGLYFLAISAADPSLTTPTLTVATMTKVAIASFIAHAVARGSKGALSSSSRAAVGA